jgi:hypothetical protein
VHRLAGVSGDVYVTSYAHPSVWTAKPLPSDPLGHVELLTSC